MKLKRKLRDDAIRAVLAGERQYVVARRYGVSPATINRMMALAGVLPPPTIRQKVLKYRSQYPGANRSEIARAVGTTLGYVNEVLAGADRNMRRLGREAMLAGLTISDIRAIARERRAQ